MDSLLRNILLRKYTYLYNRRILNLNPCFNRSSTIVPALSTLVLGPLSSARLWAQSRTWWPSWPHLKHLFVPYLHSPLWLRPHFSQLVAVASFFFLPWEWVIFDVEGFSFLLLCCLQTSFFLAFSAWIWVRRYSARSALPKQSTIVVGSSSLSLIARAMSGRNIPSISWALFSTVSAMYGHQRLRYSYTWAVSCSFQYL